MSEGNAPTTAPAPQQSASPDVSNGGGHIPDRPKVNDRGEYRTSTAHIIPSQPDPAAAVDDLPRIESGYRITRPIHMNEDGTYLDRDQNFHLGDHPNESSQKLALESNRKTLEDLAPAQSDNEMETYIQRYSKELMGNKDFESEVAKASKEFGGKVTYKMLAEETGIHPAYIQSIREMFGDQEATPERIAVALKAMNWQKPQPAVQTNPEIIQAGHQKLQEHWGLDETGYRERMTLLKQAFDKLPNNVKPSYDSVDGARKLWAEMNQPEPTQRPNVPEFQRSTPNAPSLGAQPKFMFKQSQLDKMSNAEYKQRNQEITHAYNNGLVQQDTGYNQHVYKSSSQNPRGY